MTVVIFRLQLNYYFTNFINIKYIIIIIIYMSIRYFRTNLSLKFKKIFLVFVDVDIIIKFKTMYKIVIDTHLAVCK